MRILILGGCGFVGSSLAALYRQHGDAEVVVFDNLRRRGSERNVTALGALGARFIHGDVRSRGDLEEIKGPFDLVIDASAEPSVQAGHGSTGLAYLLETNLLGAINALDLCRRIQSPLVFLSTSRVFSISALRSLPLVVTGNRFELEDSKPSYATRLGLDESFPVVGQGPRSLYGATKIAAEIFVEEYAHAFDLPAVVNRCGVLCGPGQFGRSDQGVFTLWVAHHVLDKPLRYTGYGGKGLQVRDLLAPEDLFDLIERQRAQIGDLRGEVYCAGGGAEGSVSLSELTGLCQEATGHRVEIGIGSETSNVDVPWIIMSSARARERFGWAPATRPAEIVGRIARWLRDDLETARALFG